MNNSTWILLILVWIGWFHCASLSVLGFSGLYIGCFIATKTGELIKAKLS